MDDIIFEKHLPVNYIKSPRAGRRQTYTVNNEDKKPESKKWSFGGFFRRRKKSVESDSSSQDDTQHYTRKSFMSRRKKSGKKEDKHKKKVVGTFDHIVIHPTTIENGFSHHDGVMSDPSGGFIGYLTRRENNVNINENGSVGSHKPNSSVETSKSSHESLIKAITPSSRNESSYAGSYGSLDSSSKKRHRERARQRRDKIYNNEENTSSDEGSQRSTTSSLTRIKSDSDSIAKLSRENSINRRTRSARTERYIKRLSREDENVLNREAEIVKGHYKQRSTSISPVLKRKVVHLPATNSVYPSSQQPPNTPTAFQTHLVHRKPPLFGHNHQLVQPNDTYNRIGNSHNDLYQNMGVNDLHNHHDVRPLPLQRTTSNEYYMPKQKSWSLENNMHRASPKLPNNDNFSYYTPPIYPLQSTYSKNLPQPYISSPRSPPPPPPPRDPQRRIVTVANFYENSPRPMSYAFENNQRKQTNSLQRNQTTHQPLHPHANVDRTASIRSIHSVNYPPIIGVNNRLTQPHNFRSNSDDHISHVPEQLMQLRPASVTPDTTVGPQKRYISRHRYPNEQAKYQFFTDQVPRSRRPIHCVPLQHDQTNQYLSDSQVDMKSYPDSSKTTELPTVQSATEFWRQREKEEAQRKSDKKLSKKIAKLNTKNDELSKHITPIQNYIERKENSPNLGAPKTEQLNEKVVQTSSVTLKQSEISSSNASPYNSLKRRDSNSFRPLSMVLEKPETQDKSAKDPPLPPTRRSSRQNSASSIEMAEWLNSEYDEKPKSRQGFTTESPVPAPRLSIRQDTPPVKETVDCVDAPKVIEHHYNSVTSRRKSTNLEDALNELEAIYKSLHLGDEDLLERAERRDIPTFVRKGTPPQNDTQNNDFKYSSSSIDSLLDGENPRRIKHSSRRSGIPDKVNDDMAFRKLKRNDLSPSFNSTKDSAVSQISYLLASPDLSIAPSPDFLGSDSTSKNKEPDITLDDMVYRNLKHTNNTLKVLDPQPPFGIPIGPITPAANSDYLHAKPENRPRSRFIPQKLPDIVKDDLAFRSLRKDELKDALLLPEDFKNNNNEAPKQLELRKKRAVRSLSANLYNIIQKETNKFENFTLNEMEKTHSLTNMNVEKLKKNENLLDSPTSTETLTESHNNILSDSEGNKNVRQRLRVYIPQESSSQCHKTIPDYENICKSSSHSPKKAATSEIPSAEEDISHLNQTQLDLLLINLAKETQEESKKLEIELQELSSATEAIQSKDHEEWVSESPKERHSSTPKLSTDEQLTAIENVSQHAKLCEKLLECVVESTDLITVKAPEKPEKLCEDIDDVSSHAKLCEKLLECVVESAELGIPEKPIIIPNKSSSMQDKLSDINLVSQQAQKCEKLIESVVESRELLPNEPKKETLPDSMDEDISDSDDPKAPVKQQQVITAVEITTFGNECVEQFDESDLESTVANIILLRKPDSPSEILLDNVDSDRLSTEVPKSEEYDNIDSVSTDKGDMFDPDEREDDDISPFEAQKMSILEDFAAISQELREDESKRSAGSPKEMVNNNFRGQDFEESNHPNMSSKIPVFQYESDRDTPSPVSDCQLGSRSEGHCNVLVGPGSSSQGCSSDVALGGSWQRDSKSVALTCAYVLACTHQLATVDVLTVLGIILAVISVIAALVV